MRERNKKLDEYLNETYPTVRIGALEFEPADIVYELDPIAYDQMAWDLGFGEDDNEDDE